MREHDPTIAVRRRAGQMEGTRKALITPAIERDTSRSGYNIFYSSAVGDNIAKVLGAPHYSYYFAEAKFVSALTARGFVPQKLQMPEFYSSRSSLPDGTYNANFPDVHLIFRSTEQFRLLKFARNVCCFAWEFDVLNDQTAADEHPFLNQKRMLSLCDEVWVPCRYTQRTLASHGLDDVHVIPAPVSVTSGPQVPLIDTLPYVGHCVVTPLRYNFLLSPEQNKAGSADRTSTLAEYIGNRLQTSKDLRIYLSILNPEDFRKNLDAMLRGFYHFSADRSDALLLVKVLTSASRFELLDVTSNVIPNKLDSGTAISSDNILFFNDFLTDAEMDHLFYLADYYLCTSLCEGQNLPLLEAMAHGVVPITTANTAMADYIARDHAILIEDQSVPNDIVHLAGTVARKPFSIRRSRADQVYAALKCSDNLTESRYGEMSAKARQVVREQYAPDVVCERIERRLAALGTAAPTNRVEHV
jgi:glycosyltransferase involved in cell wall biosynthesis